MANREASFRADQAVTHRCPFFRGEFTGVGAIYDDFLVALCSATSPNFAVCSRVASVCLNVPPSNTQCIFRTHSNRPQPTTGAIAETLSAERRNCALRYVDSPMFDRVLDTLGSDVNTMSRADGSY